MRTGTVFEIKEFAIHDGPGVRTTVFMKGCPLDCTWCHNPEGKSRFPQVMKTPVSERWVGVEYTSKELAQRLNNQADIFRVTEGGITFSGGEPLMQAEFLLETIEYLQGIHVLLDTSGYGDRNDFLNLLSKIDLVYFDLKLIDPVGFRAYAGGEIDIILENLQILSSSGTPFVIRVPLIPGVTDTESNLTAITNAIRDLSGLIRVDLLPYNRLAGAKYESVNMVFDPGFDETIPVKTIPETWMNLNVPWSIV